MVLETDSSDSDTETNGLEIGGAGASKIEFVQCDLADIIAVRRAAEYARRRTERLDMLFCNAGMCATLLCLANYPPITDRLSSDVIYI